MKSPSSGSTISPGPPRQEEMSGRNLLIRERVQLRDRGTRRRAVRRGWGRVELGSFEAEEDGVVMDGEVTSTFLGADVSRDGWLAGVAFSMSQGDGDFELMEGEDQGTVESTLTSVYPYARVRMNERMDGWGLVGFGSGELTLRHGMPGHRWVEYTTDIDMHMGAAGLRGRSSNRPSPGDSHWRSSPTRTGSAPGPTRSAARRDTWARPRAKQAGSGSSWKGRGRTT